MGFALQPRHINGFSKLQRHKQRHVSWKRSHYSQRSFFVPKYSKDTGLIKLCESSNFLLATTWKPGSSGVDQSVTDSISHWDKSTGHKASKFIHVCFSVCNGPESQRLGALLRSRVFYSVHIARREFGKHGTPYNLPCTHFAQLFSSRGLQ